MENDDPEERVEADPEKVEQVAKALLGIDLLHRNTLKAIIDSFGNGDICYDLQDVEGNAYGAYKDFLGAFKKIARDQNEQDRKELEAEMEADKKKSKK